MCLNLVRIYLHMDSSRLDFEHVNVGFGFTFTYVIKNELLSKVHESSQSPLRSMTYTKMGVVEPI